MGDIFVLSEQISLKILLILELGQKSKNIYNFKLMILRYSKVLTIFIKVNTVFNLEW